MKQKTLRVFEVEDFEKLKNIVEKKYELVKNYYFMLKKPDENIQNYLKEKGLNYFVLNTNESFTSKKEIIHENLPKIRIIEKEIIKSKENNVKIFDRIIRSGEEIKYEGDVVFLKRINAGAKIDIKGNVIILDENSGRIECEGKYILVMRNKSYIFFNKDDLGIIDKLTFFYEDKKAEI